MEGYKTRSGLPNTMRPPHPEVTRCFRTQFTQRRQMLQELRNLPGAHDDLLDGCASPDYRKHRYYTTDYEQRRRKTRALQDMMGVRSERPREQRRYREECYPAVCFGMNSRQIQSELAQEQGESLRGLHPNSESSSRQTKIDQSHSNKRKRGDDSSSQEGEDEHWTQKRIKYHQASDSVQTSNFRPTPNQLRIAKRVAPRRMKTRSMDQREPVPISNRKGHVKVWHERRGKDIELPFDDYERFFVGKSSLVMIGETDNNSSGLGHTPSTHTSNSPIQASRFNDDISRRAQAPK